MIEIKNVFITFNRGTVIENPVLRGLSLTVQQGEFISVIGSNGAGKSTLLNAISGDYAIDSGDILIHGKSVAHSTSWQRANLVARVFQDPMAGTCETLTIEENMALAYQRGQKRGLRFSLNRTLRELFKEKLSLLGLGLENRLTDQMGRLSGGQRQAISLLMASLQPSNILLLDEHTAALDPKTTEFVLNLTDNIVREHKLTTLMVTHSMRQALDYGDRTVMLHQGQVAFDVSGSQRKQMDVPDLLTLFEQHRQEKLSDDSLLLT
ncbi:putative ABC transport system ATP-binding protein [Nicoletella semolina]|uniref:Putative ABC transport system ATP-binding protein n=1 Tax=Nicoletella semolina TaxID=271160 RepID=A0A4R2N8P2_9PAST|nr:ABC transporter ATP-binding protein [Nicoletella semolina]MDH2924518.1 ABC transporter ATP-binding protein [Nicoletella semolina]TCP17354.1 putative ABC transport system ATP-binding protein [Nicoletella semolina]